MGMLVSTGRSRFTTRLTVEVHASGQRSVDTTTCVAETPSELQMPTSQTVTHRAVRPTSGVRPVSSLLQDAEVGFRLHGRKPRHARELRKGRLSTPCTSPIPSKV
jgi:hypothetical protein